MGCSMKRGFGVGGHLVADKLNSKPRGRKWRRRCIPPAGDLWTRRRLALVSLHLGRDGFCGWGQSQGSGFVATFAFVHGAEWVGLHRKVTCTGCRPAQGIRHVRRTPCGGLRLSLPRRQRGYSLALSFLNSMTSWAVVKSLGRVSLSVQAIWNASLPMNSIMHLWVLLASVPASSQMGFLP